MSLRAMLIASPIPRVPPVTMATRAMTLSRFCFYCSGLGRRPPSRKFAPDQRVKHRHPLVAVVQAVEPREMGPAGVDERLAAANAELLKSFEAVHREARGRNGDALDAL